MSLHVLDFALSVLCLLAGMFFMGMYAASGALAALALTIALCVSSLICARLFADKH